MQDILREQGAKGLFSGLTPRILKVYHINHYLYLIIALGVPEEKLCKHFLFGSLNYKHRCDSRHQERSYIDF